MTDEGSERELEELEDHSPDDEVIGRALKKSLLAIGAAAVLFAVGYLLVGSGAEEAPEVSIETEAPVAVRAETVAPRVLFTDITATAGIDFVHENGAAGDKLLPESMGSGAAFFDYDNDDDQDLLLINGRGWITGSATRATSALYRNDGDGNFSDVSAETGLDVELYGTGVAVGDFDADGLSDLFIAAVGSNRLLRNLGDRFVDVTATAGVAGEADAWSTSAGFVDVDNDGDLDLFVTNYVKWSEEIDFEVDFRLTGVGRAYGPPVNYEGTFSYLYRNEGDGTFSDVSEESGIQVRNAATGVPVGKGLGLAPIDIDGDGWMDLFVANDTVRNFLFHNLGDGTFEEVAELWGLAYGRAGEATGAMGVDSGFYRNDAELGFVIGNFANEMTSLYISQGDPTIYADEAIGEGIGAPSRTLLSFGMLLFDYDLDGRLDILETNGHLETEIATVDPSQSYEQPAQLFWNAGPEARQGFVPVPIDESGDLAEKLVGRGSAFADIDGDGDLDVVLTQTGRRTVLLRNDQELGHHWLRLKLVGPGGSEAIGARVVLTRSDERQVRQVMPTRSYQSQSELPVTFGLGSDSSFDTLEIVWPDGTVQSVDGAEVDRLTRVEAPS